LELTVLDVGHGEGRAPQLPSIVRGGLRFEERQIQMVATGRTVALQPGDLLRVPSDALTYRIRATDGQAAFGLRIALMPPAGAGEPGAAGGANRGTSATDAGSPATGWVWLDGVDGSPRWTASRITLGPGAAVAMEKIDGPAVLVVERGSLGVAVELGEASVQGDAAAGAIVAEDQDVVVAGASVLLQPGAAMTLRNAGGVPVSLVVVAVVLTAD
jgi:hypothetical protein